MRAVSALCLAAVLASMVGAASAADSKGADAKVVTNKTVEYCAGGLERILPGEYYFCAAVRDMGHGHKGLARDRLRDAAYWASKPAQYILGLMNFDGDDGRGNRPLGVAWLALASERHDPRFEPAFAKAYIELTPEERAQADVYWNDLKKDYSDAVAGRRARRVYTREMNNLQAAAMFGGSIFIDGMTPPGIASSGGGQPPIFEGESGFSVSNRIHQAADDLFHGMEGTVTVGEVQPANLVPIGNVAAKAPPAKQ